MGGRATRNGSPRARRTVSTGLKWTWPLATFFAACFFASLGADIRLLTFKGTGYAVMLTAVGVPLPRVATVKVPFLLWVAHILFWTPPLAWVVSRVRRAQRRRNRRDASSGNPAKRAAAGD